MVENERCVVRRWIARATAEGAAGYARWFEENLAPELAELAGHLGAVVALRSLDGGEVEIAVDTWWASMAAVRGFAGEDVERAVVEPEAREFLLAFDELVTHAEVVVNTTR